MFLQLNHVTKRYENHLAVNDVSLNIPKGKIYGLLGPNGAGKTSIIRMITGITVPDEGQMLFGGKPWAEHHVHAIGYMPEERGLYKKMKVREQIIYLLNLKGMKDAAAKDATNYWLTKMGLMDWADKTVTDLSKGMQQKAQFIATVAHNPELLILDEPFSGLDPVNARVLEETMMELRAAGTTIIFSTHRLEQVEEFCDHIALINGGKVILEDSVTAVRKQFQKNQYRVEYLGDRAEIERIAASNEGWTATEITDHHAIIQQPVGSDGKALMRALIDSSLEIHSIALALPRLNDIFIELVGGTAATASMRDE